VGRRADEPARGYVQDVDGGPPRAITAEEVVMRGVPVSPDSRCVAWVTPDGATVLQPLDGSPPTPAPGILPGEVLIRWSGDGGSLFVYTPGALPTRVFRVAIESGERTLAMELAPSDPAGVAGIGQVRLTPDGRTCVYAFKRTLSELYLVEGQT